MNAHEQKALEAQAKLNSLLKDFGSISLIRLQLDVLAAFGVLIRVAPVNAVVALGPCLVLALFCTLLLIVILGLGATATALLLGSAESSPSLTFALLGSVSASLFFFVFYLSLARFLLWLSAQWLKFHFNFLLGPKTQSVGTKVPAESEEAPSERASARSRRQTRLRLAAFGLTFALSVVFFALASSKARSTFPQSALMELSRKVSPVLQLRSVRKSIDSKGLVALDLEARDLEIEIEKSDSLKRDDFGFELEGRFAVENKEPLKISQSEGVLRVEVAENLRRKQWLSQFSGPMKGNRLKVLLPSNFSGKLRVRTNSGATQLSGVRSLSELDWESVSGNLSVSKSEVFVARLSSVSGQVDYEASTSELSVQLTSGDSVFHVSGLDRFLGAKLDLFSTSGRMEIGLPKASSLRYSLSSLTGQLATDLPGKPTGEPGSGQTREGQLGKGAGELRARTISGDLKVYLETDEN